MLNEQEVLAEAETRFGLSGSVAIARGGQKAVYRSTMAGLDVAVKVTMLPSSVDPTALERCEREVDLLRRLDSPHLVKALTDLVTIGTGPDAAVWVEEYLDGHDLSSMLGPQRSWVAVSELLIEVGSGLAEMHSSGFVHRDLSPGNVRRTSTGWKVLDPGLAKHLNRSSITGIWQPGTPGHLSPEHGTLGGRITPASDVFCLGILAYAALTGVLPISPAGTPEEYRQRLVHGVAPSVAVARGGLTSAQVAIVDRCLARQPARRYLDAGEVVDAVLGANTPGDA